MAKNKNSFDQNVWQKLRKKAEQGWDKYQDREHRKKGKGEYVFDLLVNLVLLWVANNLLDWNIPFLTASFEAVLAVLNISILANIIGSLLLIVHDGHWFRGFIKLIENSIGFVFILTAYIIFPFDFSIYSGFDFEILAKILLILGMVGNGIAVIVEFFRMVFGQDYHRDRA